MWRSTRAASAAGLGPLGCDGLLGTGARWNGCFGLSRDGRGLQIARMPVRARGSSKVIGGAALTHPTG